MKMTILGEYEKESTARSIIKILKKHYINCQLIMARPKYLPYAKWIIIVDQRKESQAQELLYQLPEVV